MTKHSCNAVMATAMFALAIAAPRRARRSRQARITLIELTPHLAVNDAAALIEAENYAGAIEILDTFIANQPEPVPEAFYLLGLAHYQLGDYAKARPAGRARRDDGARRARELARARRRRAEAQRRSPRGDPVARAARRASAGQQDYWLELSVAYEKIDDYDRALATMRLAHTAELLDATMPISADSPTCSCNRGLPQQGAEVLEQRARGTDRARPTRPRTRSSARRGSRPASPTKPCSRSRTPRASPSTGDAYVRLAVVHVAREDWPAAVAALHAGMGRGSLTDAAQANLLMGVALYAQRQVRRSARLVHDGRRKRSEPRRRERLPRRDRGTARLAATLALLPHRERPTISGRLGALPVRGKGRAHPNRSNGSDVSIFFPARQCGRERSLKGDRHARPNCAPRASVARATP